LVTCAFNYLACNRFYRGVKDFGGVADIICNKGAPLKEAGFTIHILHVITLFTYYPARKQLGFIFSVVPLLVGCSKNI
jgi:hypothetical protein